MKTKKNYIKSHLHGGVVELISLMQLYSSIVSKFPRVSNTQQWWWVMLIVTNDDDFVVFLLRRCSCCLNVWKNCYFSLSLYTHTHVCTAKKKNIWENNNTILISFNLNMTHLFMVLFFLFFQNFILDVTIVDLLCRNSIEW